MKVRTLTDLFDRVDAETAWRKHELSLLRTAIGTSSAASHSAAVRSGIALLYAHWEGWIRNVSILYLTYVRTQRLSYSELNTALFAGAVRGKLKALAESGDPSSHIAFAEFLRTGLSERSRLSDDLTATSSNLSSSVLERIVVGLGLGTDFFDTRRKMIDEQIVAARNSVAHGEYLQVGRQDYFERHEVVLEMLGSFTDLVLNAAATEEFRASMSLRVDVHYTDRSVG